MTGPISKVRLGGVECAVWLNKDKDGREYKTFSFQRSYKVGEEWKHANSFRLNDLPKLWRAAQQAFDAEFTKPASDAQGDAPVAEEGVNSNGLKY